MTRKKGPPWERLSTIQAGDKGILGQETEEREGEALLLETGGALEMPRSGEVLKGRLEARESKQGFTAGEPKLRSMPAEQSGGSSWRSDETTGLVETANGTEERSSKREWSGAGSCRMDLDGKRLTMVVFLKYLWEKNTTCPFQTSGTGKQQPWDVTGIKI